MADVRFGRIARRAAIVLWSMMDQRQQLGELNET
jgi:hypothetical protein